VALPEEQFPFETIVSLLDEFKRDMLLSESGRMKAELLESFDSKVLASLK